jgi:hypothetical protein
MWPFNRKPDEDTTANDLIKSINKNPKEGFGKADAPAWVRVLLLALTGRWPLAILQIILLILEKSAGKMPAPQRIEAYQSINRLRALTFDHSDAVVSSLAAK